VLNGVKRWITNAGVSKYYTVMAVTDPAAGANGMCIQYTRCEFSAAEICNTLPNFGSSWRAESATVASHLRSAWERAVEQHLLLSVVQRQVRAIQTQKVGKISIAPEDIKELDRAMTLLSGWGPPDGSAASHVPRRSRLTAGQPTDHSTCRVSR
jgi:hypothetical protein